MCLLKYFLLIHTISTLFYEYLTDMPPKWSSQWWARWLQNDLLFLQCFLIISGLLHWSYFNLTSCLSLLCTSRGREALREGLPILRMEVLGGERGRCCCRGRGWLQVHIATGARLFGPRRATPSRWLSVHTGTFTACHFPTEGVEVGKGCGRKESVWDRIKRNDRWKQKKATGRKEENVWILRGKGRPENKKKKQKTW